MSSQNKQGSIQSVMSSCTFGIRKMSFINKQMRELTTKVSYEQR
jgi:hypothetical protein